MKTAIKMMAVVILLSLAANSEAQIKVDLKRTGTARQPDSTRKLTRLLTKHWTPLRTVSLQT
jgi:hypothetical protein